MSSNDNELNEVNENESAFTLLASGKPRWRSFGTSFGLEFILLACAIWIPMLFPKQMVKAKNYVFTAITAPVLTPYKPQPKVQPRRVVKQPVIKTPEVAKPEVAKIDPPVQPKPEPKLIEPVFSRPVMTHYIVRNNPTPAPKINEFARAVPDVKTDSMGSSALPDLKRPRAPVQTGGFGDPEGLKSASKVTHPVNINQAGGFDMPVGEGKGNGTGGKKGREGVVASAGFGANTAIAGGRRDGGKVQQGVFADQRASGAPQQVHKKANETPNTTPVVILYKPDPQYTAEARKERIQGDVLVSVLFKSSGEVQVLRVIQGLGHGLDENAVAAARQIKFKPARQDGQPVDFPATVRIQFELAY